MKRIFKSRFWFVLIGLAGYAWGIVWLTDHSGWELLLTKALHFTPALAGLIGIQALLWFLNFGIETARWQMVSGCPNEYRWRKAVRVTFVAQALGSFTPGRVGEHAGRILMARAGSRTGAMAGSLLLSATMSVSIAAWAVLFSPFVLLSGTSIFFWWMGLGVLVLLVLAALLWMVFRLQWARLRWALGQIRWVWRSMSRVQKFGLWGLTLGRVAVFGIQLAFMLAFWTGTGNPVELWILIPVYLVAITLIPSVFLADLGVKGSIGLAIFSATACAPEGVVLALFFIWCLNTLIPAWLGYGILMVKGFRSGI